MHWNNLPVGRKIAVGFAVVLILLVTVGGFNYTGVGNIVKNAAQVIEGNKLDALLAQREVDHLSWANRVNALLTNENTAALDVEMDDHKCGFGKWLYGEGRAEAERFVSSLAPLLKSIEEPHRKLHESAVHIASKLKASGASLPASSAAKETEEGLKEAKQLYVQETLPALEATRKLLKEIRAEAGKHIMTDEAMLDAAQTTRRNVTLIGVVALFIGIFFAFFISKGITSALKAISHQMEEGAEQVASASGQVSSASQSLAEGASQQAASLEETSSALEEMASLTRQNADRATHAQDIMKQGSQVLEKAARSMSEVTVSMQEISRASEQTSKIIKTIDEIAFQTNLLALNAAVEAARAGEAGAGFAVVAEEVRNLAMRAAEAAKNTAGLIEGTVKRIKEGSELVNRTNDEFSSVSTNISEMGALVGDIASSSQEQAKGVEQISKAVAEMDMVTQQNAANAEESASASEELNAQANHMRGIVHKLIAMVGGNMKGSHAAPHQVSEATDASGRFQRSEVMMLAEEQKGVRS